MPAIRSVGGIRGLSVKFVGAEQTKRALAMLPAAIQRRVLRNAVAAAARPVTRAIKAGARTASAQSRRHEGVGTTSRAIIQKVATSKRDPAVAFAKIGARRGYTEFIQLDKTRVSGITAERRTRRRRGAAKVTRRSLKNLGPAARKARLNPKSNTSNKRTPTRYLHLIEKGSRRSRGHGFMQQAAAGQISASRGAFARIMHQGVQREFSKMAAK